MEVEDVEIRLHVVGVGGAGEGEDAEVEGEAEGDLGDGAIVAGGDFDELWGREGFAVGGEEGEALVDDVVGIAELANRSPPAVHCEAAVLYETRCDAGFVAEELELGEGDIADAEDFCLAGVVNGFHGLPGVPVVGSQSNRCHWSVEDVGIDVLNLQVFQRTGERLLDLRGDRGVGIVGQAIVLAGAEREFGLQEQIVPCDQAGGDGVGDGLADGRFMVVPPLVGSIDAAESLLDGQFGEVLGVVLFPGGAVEEVGVDQGRGHWMDAVRCQLSVVRNQWSVLSGRAMPLAVNYRGRSFLVMARRGGACPGCLR